MKVKVLAWVQLRNKVVKQIVEVNLPDDVEHDDDAVDTEVGNWVGEQVNWGWQYDRGD